MIGNFCLQVAATSFISPTFDIWTEHDHSLYNFDLTILILLSSHGKLLGRLIVFLISRCWSGGLANGEIDFRANFSRFRSKLAFEQL